MITRIALSAIFAVLLCGSVSAKSHSSHPSGTARHPHVSTKSYPKSYCTSCARDSHGKIKRSPEARHEFQREHPCPSTGRTSGGCPGYVIDHVQALKHGGADAPENMQWQTKAEAKAKDRIED